MTPTRRVEDHLWKRILGDRPLWVPGFSLAAAIVVSASVALAVFAVHDSRRCPGGYNYNSGSSTCRDAGPPYCDPTSDPFCDLFTGPVKLRPDRPAIINHHFI